MGVALQGLKVLDFSQAVAGAFAATMLADFGADVIKVESPKGDFLRSTGAFKDAWFCNDNRNKKIISMDLRFPETKEIFTKMIKEADVFIENFRPGSLEKLGFGWEDVHKINPRIIMARISGWGQDGPYKDKSGIDRVAVAVGGLSYVTGFADGLPVRPSFSIADYDTGIFTAYGILAALYNRDVVGTGEGQFIDSSLYESIVRISESMIIDYSIDGRIRGRMGNASQLVPSGHYETKDGQYVVMAAGGDKPFRNWSKAIGMPELADDPRFDSQSKRNNCREELEAIAVKWHKEHTMNEILAAYGTDVSASKIYSVKDMFEDPQFKARHTIVEVDSKEFGKKVSVSNVYPRLSATPGEIKWLGGEQGADNEEIYKGKFGLTDEQFEALKAKGAI